MRVGGETWNGIGRVDRVSRDSHDVRRMVVLHVPSHWVLRGALSCFAGRDERVEREIDGGGWFGIGVRGERRGRGVFIR